MNAAYFQDDLVLVRPKPQYVVGDAILYINPDIGPTFHRIVQREGNTFTVKGDNNSWLDSYHPNVDDILGSAWLHFPKAGKHLEFLRKPINFTILITSAFFVILKPVLFDGPEDTADINKHNDFYHERDISMNTKFTDYLYFFVVALICSIILAYLSFSKPINQQVADDIHYVNHGRLDYFAFTSESVYKDGVLSSGNTIFRSLTDSINIIYEYKFLCDQPSVLYGSQNMVAYLRDSDGWEYPLEISPVTNFSSNESSIQTTLDLRYIQNVIDRLETKTGVNNRLYYLFLVPEIQLDGSIRDRTFHDTFSPEFVFLIDDLTMRFSNVNLDGNDNIENHLIPTQTGTIPGLKETANTLSIFGIEMNVLFARLIAVYGILFSLGLLAWSMIRINKIKNMDDIKRAELQYGLSFIEVQEEPIFPHMNTIHVESLEELTKVAVQDHSMIYHHDVCDVHHYYVTPRSNPNFVYHYETISE